MAGVSEVFNLDFKFGGNAEFLARLEKLMERVDARFKVLGDDIEEAADATNDMADEVDDLSDSLKDGEEELKSFGDRLKEVVKNYTSLQAISSGVRKVWSFGMASMETYATQERAENQFKGVLRNRGSLDQFDSIKNYAADIQGRSIYGDEAMIKAAGELSTYVKGTDSVKKMMTILTDYAAGMTGGGEVSADQMESFATGLGMAYDGNYMAMRRKGFDTTKLEALDAIVESGGVWGEKQKKKYGDVLDQATLDRIKELGGVSEGMRVAALEESLKDWKGLSDAVSNLDSSVLIKFNNKVSDLRENIGKRLYPVLNKLIDTIDSHMPDIEAAFSDIGDMFITLSESLEKNIDTIKSVVKTFTTLIEVVAKFPQISIAAVLSLNMLAKGSFTAAGGLGKLAMSAGMAQSKINKLSVAAGLFAGVAVGGTLGPGAGALEGGVTNGMGGVLGAVATSALAGAAAFGTLGAAAAAAATAVCLAYKSISDEISAYLSLKETEENWNNKDKSFKNMLTMQKQIKEAEKRGDIKTATRKRGDLQLRINDFESRWGEGSAGTGLKATAFGGFSNYEAYLKRKGAENGALKDAMVASKIDVNNTNNYTTIEQNVSLATDIQKVGILLNQNIRAIIESQMRQNREVGLATR